LVSRRLLIHRSIKCSPFAFWKSGKKERNKERKRKERERKEKEEKEKQKKTKINTGGNWPAEDCSSTVVSSAGPFTFPAVTSCPSVYGMRKNPRENGMKTRGGGEINDFAQIKILLKHHFYRHFLLAAT
jgi:hypothetical protein